MRKLLVFIFLSIAVSCFGQSNFRYEIDTLKAELERNHMKYRTYKNDKLISEREAYAFPVKKRVARFHVFGNPFFRREIEADSLVYHGYSLMIEENGYHRKQYYENGKLIHTQFFDPEGESINGQVFIQHNERIYHDRICAEDTGHFFIHGGKKSK